MLGVVFFLMNFRRDINSFFGLVVLIGKVKLMLLFFIVFLNVYLLKNIKNILIFLFEEILLIKWGILIILVFKSLFYIFVIFLVMIFVIFVFFIYRIICDFFNKFFVMLSFKI